MALGGIAFGFLAGALSVLSPCVLPILPFVFGSATSAHRFGPVALAAGLVSSFVVTVGLFVATVGFAIGLDGDAFRTVSALLLAAIGTVLLLDVLKQRFALAVSGVGNSGARLLRRLSPGGLLGQFAIGLVLGAVWSPCVGPTLGAASVLASQGRSLGSVVTVMAAFGAGTALGPLTIGALSREALRRWQRRLAGSGNFGTHLLGGAALAVAVLILTGADRSIEAALVGASPGAGDRIHDPVRAETELRASTSSGSRRCVWSPATKWDRAAMACDEQPEKPELAELFRRRPADRLRALHPGLPGRRRLEAAGYRLRALGRLVHRDWPANSPPGRWSTRCMTSGWLPDWRSSASARAPCCSRSGPATAPC